MGHRETNRRCSETTHNPTWLKPAVPLEKTSKSTPNLPLVNDTLDDQIDKVSVLFHSTSDIAGFTTPYQNAERSQHNKKFNWRVALRKESILMGIGSLFFVAGLSVVYQCIPPLGKSSGVSKETVALLLSIAGGVEIPCRIFNGMLADRKFVSAITQLSVCMGLAGVAAFLCGSISGLAGICIMLFTISMCGSTVFSLIPIASGELLGQENVTTALGINMFYQSLAILISVFSTGAIYDGLGKWEYVFFYIGGVMITGSFINVFVALSRYFSSRKVPVEKHNQPESTRFL